MHGLDDLAGVLDLIGPGQLGQLVGRRPPA
jgi:hypothetical protein